MPRAIEDVLRHTNFVAKSKVVPTLKMTFSDMPLSRHGTWCCAWPLRGPLRLQASGWQQSQRKPSIATSAYPVGEPSPQLNLLCTRNFFCSTHLQGAPMPCKARPSFLGLTTLIIWKVSSTPSTPLCNTWYKPHHPHSSLLSIKEGCTHKLGKSKSTRS